MPEPIRGDDGAPILRPQNAPLEGENPDHIAAPRTDSGTVPNLKFSPALAILAALALSAGATACGSSDESVSANPASVEEQISEAGQVAERRPEHSTPEDEDAEAAGGAVDDEGEGPADDEGSDEDDEGSDEDDEGSDEE